MDEEREESKEDGEAKRSFDLYFIVTLNNTALYITSISTPEHHISSVNRLYLISQAVEKPPSVEDLKQFH